MTASPCPKCNARMIRRNSSRGAFWGCSQYPKCNGTRRIERDATPIRTPAQPPVDVQGSPEQVAIWRAIEAGNSHIVVNALAGTGKSFTCRTALWRVPQSVRTCYLAFNRSIVDEFAPTAPPHAVVQTFHSAGASILRSAGWGRVDANKSRDLIDRLWPLPEDRKQASQDRAGRNAVLSLAKTIEDYGVSYDDRDAIIELASRHEIDLAHERDIVALAVQLRRDSLADTSRTSFDDMLAAPVRLGLSGPKYDLIFVDEAQDLSAAKQAMVFLLLAPGGRVVVVGDRNQAIYLFAGSDSRAIDTMSAALAKTGRTVEEYPLTVTRRCGHAIVREAQKYVPTFTALPGAAEGEVVTTTHDEAVASIQPGDMGLSRTNAVLMSTAMSLLRRRVPVTVRGRKLGDRLIAIINRTKATTIAELIPAIDQWARTESEKFANARNAQTIIEQVRDTADAIGAIASDCDTVDEVCGTIDSLFGTHEDDAKEGSVDSSRVVLSSIHRAKGLEADTVVWFAHDLHCKAEQEDAAEQEFRNLPYVATTRAKRRLVLVPKVKR